MNIRYIPVVAVLACLSVAGAPAFATDNPPPPTDTTPTDTTPADSTPTDATPATDTPGTTPTACIDTTSPRTRVVTSARTAARTHTLRGTALDSACAQTGSVSGVSVSIALKHGTKCQYLMRTARLSRSTTCKTPRFLSAKGTKSWQLKLPRKLPSGSYQILTRAVDSAGNVERAHARRLAIRQPHSTTKKK
jgi:hypothetical protein